MSTNSAAVKARSCSLPQDAELAKVLETYLADLDAGRAVDPARLIDEHPAIAEQLRACLASLQLVEQAAGSLAPTPGETGQQPEQHTLGDFRILREVGRGGMGVVYEAEQISLGRRVALKVLPFAATMDPRHLQRFHNEARAAASLDHPHIVRVHAVGCERGVHFFAMQLIQGYSLADHIRQLRQTENQSRSEGSPTPSGAETVALACATTQLKVTEPAYFRRVADWGVQAAEALEHAHSLGIVHRDVKPANLMVDAEGKLWVTDFGWREQPPTAT
jgi:serine/threonine protein kinase